MVSDSLGPSSLVLAITSPSRDLGSGLVALPPEANTFCPKATASIPFFKKDQVMPHRYFWQRSNIFEGNMNFFARSSDEFFYIELHRIISGNYNLPGNFLLCMCEDKK